MKSYFALLPGWPRSPWKGWARFPVFFCMLTATVGSPAFADPCQNEFDTWIRFFVPATQVQAQAESDEQRYIEGTEGFQARHDIEGRLGPYANWKNDPASLRVGAAMLSAARSDPATMAQYKYGACRALAKAAELGGRSNRSAARPSPVPPAKPAPVAVAEKLPKARPAKEQPWSPKSMPTDASKTLDPKYASQRADALASCSTVVNRLIADAAAPSDEIELIIESSWLDDGYMTPGPDRVRELIANNETWIATGKGAAVTKDSRLVGRCLLQRRLAQLEGSPLIAGAVDGTLTPLSIGSSNLPGPPGKDAHIIASNGKSAMDCVTLEQGPTGDGLLGTGGRVLVNRCSDSVEIGWCYSPGDCSNESGSSWTVRAGHVWPVKAAGEIRWSACHGANTQSFVRGSHGLRYYCSAPKKT